MQWSTWFVTKAWTSVCRHSFESDQSTGLIDDAGGNSKLGKVCYDAPESVLSQGELRDCSQHWWTTRLYRSPACHAFRESYLCPAKWTRSCQHSTEDGLTKFRFWSRWWRARHGQPDQPPLRPCRTHEAAYHPHTDGHQTQAIRLASGCRRCRGRRGEVQAPILEPLWNAQQHSARRAHSSELFVSDPRWKLNADPVIPNEIDSRSTVSNAALTSRRASNEIRCRVWPWPLTPKVIWGQKFSYHSESHIWLIFDFYGKKSKVPVFDTPQVVNCFKVKSDGHHLYLVPFSRYSTSKFLGFDLSHLIVIWGQKILYHSKDHIWLPIWLLWTPYLYLGPFSRHSTSKFHCFDLDIWPLKVKILYTIEKPIYDFLSGSFPSSQKCAIVTPILKKPSLDSCDLSNYRPVSNLSFISKILERSVYVQMNNYLQDNELLPEKQSAYRKFHSTETALLDMLSDVHTAADSGRVTLLALLDQSSAFDVIDHGILIDRLRHLFGFAGVVLEWVRSYVTERSQYVHFNGESSNVVHLECGVPQGSVLGPLLYILYTTDLTRIVDKHGLKAHSYADDLQIYSHVDTAQTSSLVLRLSSCVEDVKNWMAQNRLRLNPAKTELIWLGSPRRLQLCPMTPLLIAGALIQPSSHVRNLGVILDSDFSMTTHINKLAAVCFFHIRQLRLIRRSLDIDAAHALVRALIHSRLDYCNGVLAGLSLEKYRQLQSIIKASARLVLRLPRYASVTQLMHDRLHWLDVPQRIKYKLCVLTFKCIHKSAPGYLSRHCTSVSSLPGRSQLRSAAAGQLVVPFSKTKTLGDKGFVISGPSTWNSLSSELHDQTMSLFSFKKHLKTFLFQTQWVIMQFMQFHSLFI